MAESSTRIVDQLVAEFALPVTLADSRHRLLAFSDHSGDEVDDVRRASILARHTDTDTATFINSHVAGATGPVRIPANPALGMHSRVAIPVITRGVTVATIFIIDPDERLLPDRLAAHLDDLESLARDIQREDVSRQHGRDNLVSLLTGGEQERQLALEALHDTPEHLERGAVAVMAVTSRLGSLEGLPETFWSRGPGGDALWTIIGGRLVAIVPALTPDYGDDIARSLQLLAADRGSDVLDIGVGDPVTSIEHAHLSFRQALRALQVARRGPGAPDVTRWSALGAWRFLLVLSESQAREAIDDRVRAMVAGLTADQLDLVRGYLERDGDISGLAESAHVHRATIYYRLKRVNEQFGLDLGTAADRMSALLSLRLLVIHAPAPAR